MRRVWAKPGTPGNGTRLYAALIGCSSPQEVDRNAAAAAAYQALSTARMAELEERVRPLASRYAYFKRGE